MQIRKFLNHTYRGFSAGLLALSVAILPLLAAPTVHYGVRTDVLQPIHYFLDKGLWYSQLHTQIPSLATNPHHWLVSVGTGVRGVLTPYFILGVHGSFGQLNNRFGKSYLINFPSIECCFPWIKLSVHTYFMTHHFIERSNKQPIDRSQLVKRAIDMKLSATLLAFVRPFLGAYYLSRVDATDADQNAGQGHLRFTWGAEWLVSPQCSLEAQHDISQNNVLIKIKLHSAKVNKPHHMNRIRYYIREPVDQYALSIMELNTASLKQAVDESSAAFKYFETTATHAPLMQPAQEQPLNHAKPRRNSDGAISATQPYLPQGDPMPHHTQSARHASQGPLRPTQWTQNPTVFPPAYRWAVVGHNGQLPQPTASYLTKPPEPHPLHKVPPPYPITPQGSHPGTWGRLNCYPPQPQDRSQPGGVEPLRQELPTSVEKTSAGRKRSWDDAIGPRLTKQQPEQRPTRSSWYNGAGKPVHPPYRAATFPYQSTQPLVTKQDKPPSINRQSLVSPEQNQLSTHEDDVFKVQHPGPDTLTKETTN